MNFTPGQGWQEAVSSVRDLDRWVDSLDHLAGWSLAYRGRTDSRLLAAWHLSDNVQAEEAVVVCREDPSRWLRLVSFAGASQEHIRSSGQAWDTGGLFSMLIYTNDTDGAFRRAQDLGWSAHHDPVVMAFGGRELLNVVLRGPDGCNFGLYQPLAPESEAPFPFPKLGPPFNGHAGEVGPPFNGQQMVRDAATTERFYQDVLGWESWYAGEVRLTCNNFGIPDNLVGAHPKQVAIMHPGDRSYGQVELVQWTHFIGEDFSARAVPPNLGHLCLRWPVDDLDGMVERLQNKNVNLFVGPTEAHLPPMGDVKLCTVRTPDGAMIEFIQPTV